MTALREDLEILPAVAAWIAENRPARSMASATKVKRHDHRGVQEPQGGQLTDEQTMHNKAHNGKRMIGERGNSLLKMTFKDLRNTRNG